MIYLSIILVPFVSPRFSLVLVLQVLVSMVWVFKSPLYKLGIFYSGHSFAFSTVIVYQVCSFTSVHITSPGFTSLFSFLQVRDFLLPSSYN